MDMRNRVHEATLTAAVVLLSQCCKGLTTAELRSFLGARNTPAVPVNSKASLACVRPREAAQMLCVTTQTLRTWAKSGKIEMVRVTSGGVRTTSTGKKYQVGGTTLIPLKSVEAILAGKSFDAHLSAGMTTDKEGGTNE